MAKKRKNKFSGSTAEQLPSTTTTTTKRSSFESFPLYLVPNDNYSSSSSSDNSNKNYQDYDNGVSNSKSRELHEYVKGRVWVIPSFFSPKECQAWIDFCESFSDSDGDTNRSTSGVVVVVVMMMVVDFSILLTQPVIILLIENVIECKKPMEGNYQIGSLNDYRE